MKFQNLSESIQKELLEKQEITGFETLVVRTENKRIETDVVSNPADVDYNAGWEIVTHHPII
jgi:hypothetical protein